MTVKVQDENGTPINDANVTLEKDWNTVSSKADGSYDMEKGANYTLTVKKMDITITKKAISPSIRQKSTP